MTKQSLTVLLWPFVWLLSLLTIVIGSFLPEDAPVSQAISSHWWNLAHGPLYGIFAWSTLMIMSRKLTITYLLIVMTVITISLFGLAIELLQPYFGRMASLIDFSYNTMGIVIAASVFLVKKHS